MKGIVKVTAILVIFFSITFVLNLQFKFITITKLETLLKELASNPAYFPWVCLAILSILAIDSIIAVPTITTILLSGYLLGPLYGGIIASAGVLLAGTICYYGGMFTGEKFFYKLLKKDDAKKMRHWFDSYGGVSLLTARILPMFPEVLSCLAGMSKMPFQKFMTLFALGNVPFVLLAAYAGSISDFDKPLPALFVGIGLPTFGFLVYLYWQHQTKKRDSVGGSL